MGKRKILILIDYYLPGFNGGGPLRSIKNLVDQLGNEFDFKIITSDRDLGSESPYKDIKADSWLTINGIQTYYISPLKYTINNFSKLISETEHDVLYLNSFFQPRFSILIIFARWVGKIPKKPLIIAPRGELLPGCLTIKPFKKKVYLFVSKMLGFYKDLNWQASSDYEVESFKEIMGEIVERYKVVSNLPPVPAVIDYTNPRVAQTPLKVCFISRLTPEKNLEYALQVLKDVKVPLIFDIYGPKQDEDYWHLCESLMNEQKDPVIVKYCGELEHQFINDTFKKYDLFFFPSKGENFGHVIIEAMLMGTPVLLSDTTPWRYLESKGVGWDLPLKEPQSFVAAINKAYSLTSQEYADFRTKVRNYAVEVSLDQKVINASRELFLSAK